MRFNFIQGSPLALKSHHQLPSLLCIGIFIHSSTVLPVHCKRHFRIQARQIHWPIIHDLLSPKRPRNSEVFDWAWICVKSEEWIGNSHDIVAALPIGVWFLVTGSHYTVLYSRNQINPFRGRSPLPAAENQP